MYLNLALPQTIDDALWRLTLTWDVFKCRTKRGQGVFNWGLTLTWDVFKYR